MESTSEWIFRGLIGLLFFLGWWVWVKMVNSVQEVIKDVRTLDKAVGEYKLHAEQHFAKVGQVSEINETLRTVQNTINTNTNMTGITMERVNTLSEKITALTDKIK